MKKCLSYNNKTGANNPMFGKKHRQETKNLLSLMKKGNVPSNKKWDKNKIIKEYGEICKIHGYALTQKDLIKLGRTDLSVAIYRHGLNLHFLHEEIGVVSKEKPKKYWLIWENLEREIKNIISKCNFFPNISLLGYWCGSGIVKSVNFFGGIFQVAEKMGYCYRPIKKFICSDGHYVDSLCEYIFDEYLSENKIEHEVHGLIANGRKFKYDFKIGNYYFEIWGYPKENETLMGRSYNKVRKEKEEFYKTNNLELVGIECGSLLLRNKNEVYKFLDSIFKSNKFENNISSEPIVFLNKKRVNYSESEILLELKSLIDNNNGLFPSYSSIKKDYPELFGIVKRRGFPYFHKIFGCSVERKKINRKWTADVIKKEFLKAINIIGCIPTENKLKEFGFKKLLSAILRYYKYNDLVRFAEELNYKKK